MRRKPSLSEKQFQMLSFTEKVKESKNSVKYGFDPSEWDLQPALRTSPLKKRLKGLCHEMGSNI